MNKKGIIISLFSLAFAAPAYGMNTSLTRIPLSARRLPKQVPPLKQTGPIKPDSLQPDNSPTDSITFKSNVESDFPHLVRDIYINPDLNDFAAEQFVYDQKEVIKSMNKAADRGANVYLTVGSHYANKMDEYKTKALKRDPTIHGKITVGLDSSPSKKRDPNKPATGRLLVGSANTSNMTWKHNPHSAIPRFNFEAGLLVKDDMDLINKAYSMAKSQSPMKSKHKKITLLSTPEKPTLYSSKDTKLNETLALRLSNLAKKKDPHAKALVRTMTFNNKDVADALIELGSQAELIVDSSALTSTGIPLLKQISESGALVYVFYPPKDSRAKQHAKDAWLKSTEKEMYISSTANITTEGDSQRNYSLLVPNNSEVMDNAKKDFEHVKTKCIPLADALKLNETDKEDTKKRKLDAAAKKPQAKKQKLITKQ